MPRSGTGASTGQRPAPADRFRLDGRRALVTGAGGGIGAAVAHAFVARGASVALLDRSSKALVAVSKSLAKVGRDPVRRVVDVTRAVEVDRAVAQAAKALGGLDLVVTAAGVTSVGGIESASTERWRRVVDINLTGTFLVCRSAVPHLRRAGRASIVTVSSVYSLIGGKERTAYSASKGGVDALTRSMAADLAGYGIRVNSVNPGFIRTPMTAASQRNPSAMRFFRSATPLPWLGDPEDVAEAVVYLASDASRFLTGVCLPLDGGRSLGR